MSDAKTLLEIVEIGKLSKEIKANMSSGNEKSRLRFTWLSE